MPEQMTKYQQQAAQYLAMLQSNSGPRSLSGRTADYENADAATLVNGNPYQLDTGYYGNDENEAYRQQVGKQAERQSILSQPNGRALLAKRDYKEDEDFAKNVVKFYKEHPNGESGGWLGSFMENVFPYVVGAIFAGGASGLIGAEAGAVGGAVEAGGIGAAEAGGLGAAEAGGVGAAEAGASGLGGLIPEEFAADAAASYAGADAGLSGLSTELGAGGVAGAGGGDVGFLSDLLGGFDDSGLSSFIDSASNAYDDSLVSGFGDLSFSDPVGEIVSNGASFGADSAGPGYTYDMFGDVIPNEAAEATFNTQVADSTAANLANGLTATGGLTPAQYAEAASAMKGGMTAEEAAKKALKQFATPGNIKNLIGALATGAGSLLQANAARNNGAALSAASQQAAGVLAPAITNAASIQSDAAKAAGQTLSNAATAGAAAQAAGATTGAATQAAGIGQAANTLSNAFSGAAGVQSNAALQAGQTLADGYTNAAAAEAGGYEKAIGTARHTLAEQTANQKPYMDAGTRALTTLNEGLQPGGKYNRAFTMADAKNSEAYKFALGQGTQAINNASAAGGLQLSSANIESLGKFAEGTAAQYEQQAFNQWMAENNLSLGALQQMVQTGQVSTGQLQQALAQAGISVETLQSNIGRANATGVMGAANATAQAGQNAANYYANGVTNAAGAQATGMRDGSAVTAVGQRDAANYTANGLTSAANATAAGNVSAAGYLANGITGAAGVTANGITGGANSVAAGNVAGANTLANGLSAIGNQIVKSNIFDNIAATPQYSLATGPGV